ncbi:hypothetical protein WN943_002081 [Citrus x changshan-huyou]
MAFFSHIFGCFSESFDGKRYVCNGDVCVLKDQKKCGWKSLKNEKKHRVWIAFSGILRRKEASF